MSGQTCLPLWTSSSGLPHFPVYDGMYITSFLKRRVYAGKWVWDQCSKQAPMAMLLKWSVASPHSCLPRTLSTSTQASICLPDLSMASTGVSWTATTAAQQHLQLAQWWSAQSNKHVAGQHCWFDHTTIAPRLLFPSAWALVRACPEYRFGMSKMKAVQNGYFMCHCTKLYW